jgi:hypothetical protein
MGSIATAGNATSKNTQSEAAEMSGPFFTFKRLSQADRLTIDHATPGLPESYVVKGLAKPRSRLNHDRMAEYVDLGPS